MASHTDVQLYSPLVSPIYYTARLGDDWFRVPAVWNGWDSRTAIPTPPECYIKRMEQFDRAPDYCGRGLGLPTKGATDR